jgi:hypothetical protein
MRGRVHDTTNGSTETAPNHGRKFGCELQHAHSLPLFSVKEVRWL